MLKKVSLPFLAFLQTTSLVVYLILISLFFNFIAPMLGNINEKFYAPIIMLLLFVFSAVLSALLILGKAALLFFDNQVKKALVLLGWTVGWGFCYFIILIIFLIKTN